MVKAMAPNAASGARYMMIAHDAEDRVHEIVQQPDETLAALAHVAERKPEQHRHDQDRHDVALGDVADDVGRHHACIRKSTTVKDLAPVT